MRTVCTCLGLGRLLALVVGVLALVTAGARGDVPVYTQSPNPAGGQYKSAWYAPDGLDGDEYVWDAFTLASGTAITQVQWRGAYTNYLSGAGLAPVYNFTVAIYGSIAGGSQPDIVTGPLRRYTVGGNAGETAAGSAGGVNMYDYHFTFPSPFQAAAGVKYWLQIEAWQTHGHISDLYVAPDHRRRGVAQRLLTAMADLLRGEEPDRTAARLEKLWDDGKAAGITAARTPTTEAATSMPPRVAQGTDRTSSPWVRRPRCNDTPSPMPSAAPRTAPNTAVATDSMVIMPASWRRPSPTARSNPISRVRSVIDSARVFTMPSTATITLNSNIA